MVEHFFPNFLHDHRVYAQTELYWVDLWNQVDAFDRFDNDWRHPWFQPLPPDVSEGNPIFSAVSTKLKRGIRILQSEPIVNGLEFYAYPDTFGGTVLDPNAIHELVISCALSDLASHHARKLIDAWVSGKSIYLNPYGSGASPRDRHTVDLPFEAVSYSFAA